MSSRVLRWLIDTVWLLRRYRPVEPAPLVVTLTADTSAFVAAMRRLTKALEELGQALQGWHHPSNPYRHWPTCLSPIGHEVWFTTEGTQDRPCPGCKAAL